MDQGSSRFRYSMSFASTKTPTDYTWMTSFTTLYSVNSWILVQGSLPMKEFHFENLGSEVDVTGMTDLSVMANFNLTTGLFKWGAKKAKKKEKEGKGKKKKAASSPPMIFAGIGTTLPTGPYEARSDTPPYYQLGTGGMDLSISLSYFQSMGSVTPYASLSFTMCDPLGMSEYERAERMSISGGCLYTIDKKMNGQIKAALLISMTMGNDSYIDHLDTVRVINTDGMYLYLQLGYSFQVVKRMSMAVTTQIPLPTTDRGDTSGNTAAFDYQFAITIAYKF